MENNNFKKRYSFWTLIPLIIGSIIGVGSYFKIGKILSATNGNIASTIYTWIIAIIIIIATSLVIISMMSSHESSENSGGIIYVIDKHSNQHIAKLVNILVISLYSPLIIIIEAVVASKFLFEDFLQIKNSIISIISPIIFIVFMIISNFKSVKFGQWFQSASLFVKLIPLIMIIVIGLIIRPFITHETTYLNVSSSFNITKGTFNQIILAMPAALFAMDGWQWISGLSMETKGGAKILFKASITGLILASIFYILYTLGGLNLISPKIWANGAQISDVFKILFNIKIMDKIIDLFIVIAALGGLNAFSIYYIRQIAAASDNNWLFKAKYFSFITKKSNLPENAGKLALIYIPVIWLINVLLTYLFPNFWNANQSGSFDLNAGINVTSEVLTLGLWSFIYNLLSYIAIKQRLEKVSLIFKLNTFVFIICIIIMNIGALFSVYVNFVESPVVWILGVIYIFVLYYILPNKTN